MNTHRKSAKYRRQLTLRKMASSGVNDDSKEIRLVLIGKTGGGKSSLGNTILGRKEFVSKISSQSVTQKTSCENATHGSKKIRVVDTPGLFDTGDLVKKNEEWLKNEILKSTVLTVPGPHAFLYVLQIGRLTDEDMKTALKIFELFGERVYKFVIIVFTRAQELEEEESNLTAYIETLSDFFKKFLQNCGNRVLCVENKHSSEKEKNAFIDDLLSLVQTMNGCDYYKNDTIEQATSFFFSKVDEVQKQKNVQYDEAVQMTLQDVQTEGTFFKFLKSSSLGIAIAAVVGGLIMVFTPAGLLIAAGVAGVTGTVTAATAMVKDKCCIM